MFLRTIRYHISTTMIPIVILSVILANMLFAYYGVSKDNVLYLSSVGVVVFIVVFCVCYIKEVRLAYITELSDFPSYVDCFEFPDINDGDINFDVEFKPTCKNIIIVSSQASVGKTTMSRAVAQYLNNKFFKVALIDCDIERTKENDDFAFELNNSIKQFDFKDIAPSEDDLKDFDFAIYDNGPKKTEEIEDLIKGDNQIIFVVARRRLPMKEAEEFFGFKNIQFVLNKKNYGQAFYPNYYCYSSRAGNNP